MSGQVKVQCDFIYILVGLVIDILYTKNLFSSGLALL